MAHNVAFAPPRTVGHRAEEAGDEIHVARPQPAQRSRPGGSSFLSPWLERARDLGSGRRAAIVVGVAAVIAAAVVGTAVARRTDSEPASPAAALPVAAPASQLPIDVAPVASGGSASVGLAAIPAGTPSSVAPASAAATLVVVHAAGAVRVPGVYRLSDPARVDDVIKAAGGLAGDADLDALNLAARVGDGERIFVPKRGQAPPTVVVGGSVGVGFAGTVNPSGKSGASSGGALNVAAGGLIDLNTATAEQLDALPGVGPAIAGRIVDHRTRIGRFRSINQLLDVSGIGDAKFASLKNKVRV